MVTSLRYVEIKPSPLYSIFTCLTGQNIHVLKISKNELDDELATRQAMSDTEQASTDATAAATASSTPQSQSLNQKSMEILATVLQCASVDISKQVDFNTVAAKLGYKNAETAKKRYQQVRKQLLDSAGAAQPAVKKESQKNDKQGDGDESKDGDKGVGLRGGDASGNPKKRGRKPKNASAGAEDGKEKKGKRVSKKVKVEKEDDEGLKVKSEGQDGEEGKLADGGEEDKENAVKCEE
ncbi:hypothetical protein Dda_2551 [Drechslerella dactyloides]|uniref:Myb-like DNA-binding domain-containing protein n=1 Tax=Drechslerella dactyloides TaxID=74499 RepID=A0AAD6J0M8_DREDA|nr:hypothetical protein Dda_2551 [Drechslerella dactyloides]